MGSVNYHRQAEKVEEIREHPVEWAHFVRSGWHDVKAEGHLPTGPLWAYIEHRRDIDPIRFDDHHPCLAKLFKYESIHSAANIPVRPIIVPMPQSVPEPPISVLMASGLIMMGMVRLIGMRHRRRHPG